MQVLPVKAKDEKKAKDKKKIAGDGFVKYEGIKMGNVC